MNTHISKNFADYYPNSINDRRLVHTSPEAFAEFEYQDELRIKQQTFASFLRDASLPEADRITPSPCPRGYRSTGKRRITCKGERVYLHLGRTPGREAVAYSSLEPEEYQKIYEFVQKQLSMPRHRTAAEAANYCIIRGSENDHALILNVRYLSGDVVRSLRFVAEAVREKFSSVKSAFLYVDETGSDYYLEAERPEGKLGWKKLFGPEQLALRIAASEPKKFLYPPTVFSQINESILPDFASVLTRELHPQKKDLLLDLYCGYGLWSLLLASQVQSVFGAELSHEAIHAARSNAAYHYPDKNMRYETASVDASFLRRNLPGPRHDNELILLDPPRHGTLPRVLETLIARHPRKIAHVFCGVDEIPSAAKIYCANGCKIESIKPFDFFPGTLNLEVLLIVNPQKQ